MTVLAREDEGLTVRPAVEPEYFVGTRVFAERDVERIGVESDGDEINGAILDSGLNVVADGDAAEERQQRGYA